MNTRRRRFSAASTATTTALLALTVLTRTSDRRGQRRVHAPRSHGARGRSLRSTGGTSPGSCGRSAAGARWLSQSPSGLPSPWRRVVRSRPRRPRKRDPRRRPVRARSRAIAPLAASRIAAPIIVRAPLRGDPSRRGRLPRPLRLRRRCDEPGRPQSRAPPGHVRGRRRQRVRRPPPAATSHPSSPPDRRFHANACS